MKKKLLSFVLTLCTCVSVMAEVNIDGINYELDVDNRTAKVVAGSYGAVVDIPDEVQYENTYYTVTTIGSLALSNSSAPNLVAVVLPNTITTIERDAFFQSAKLRSINLPNSLVEIGYRAFYNCEKLSSIDVPDNVQTIGNECFRGCSSLATAHIGSGTSQVGLRLFMHCSSLTNITVSEDNEYYKSVDGYIITKQPVMYGSLELPANSLVSAPNGREELNIPDGVVVLANGSCSNNNVRKIVVPEGVEDISFLAEYDSHSKHAFDYCANLAYLVLPTTLGGQYATNNIAWVEQQIIRKTLPNLLAVVFRAYSNIEGDYVFSNTENKLTAYIGFDTDLTFPASYNGERYDIPDNTFQKYNAITSVNFGTGVRNVGAAAFLQCASLTSVICSDQTESIGNNAFNQCAKLERVENAKGVKSIGEGAFARCYELTSVDLSENKSLSTIGKNCFYDCTKLSQISFPTSLRNIGEGAFSGTVITEADLSATRMSSIENSVFNGCRQLQSVRLPESILVISDGAFSGCMALSDVNVPSNLIMLGSSVFRNCQSLQSITIPEGIEELGNSMFYYCTSLTTISLPSTLTSIGESCFAYCSALTDVTLPESVLTIGTSAFGSCTALASINIPSDVTSIGASAFYNTALTTITLPSNIFEIARSTFAGCRKLESITFPGALNKICTEAFNGCVALNSITLPSGLQTIEEKAFEYCNNLREIRNQSDLVLVSGSSEHGSVAYNAYRVFNLKSMETIGLFEFDSSTNTLEQYFGNDVNVILPQDYKGGTYRLGGAFYNNTELRGIKLGENVTEIGNGAFKNCTNLSNVTFNDNLSGLGQSCFENCKSLKSLTMPEDVVDIPHYAFFDCIGLEELNLSPKTKSLGFDILGEKNHMLCLIIPESVTSIAKAASETWPMVKGPKWIINNSNIVLRSYGNKVIHQRDADMYIYSNKNAIQSLRVNLIHSNVEELAMPYITHPNAVCSIYGMTDEELPFNYAVLSPRGSEMKWGARKITLQDADSYSHLLQIYIDEMRYERNFENTAWQALYLPYQMKYEDWKDYAEVAEFVSATDDANGVVLNCRTITSGSISPNTPYIIKPHSAGKVTFISKDVVVEPTPDEGSLTPLSLTTDKYLFNFWGNFQNRTDMFANQYYGLSNGKFCQAQSSNVALCPFRIYLSIIDRQTGLAVTINSSSHNAPRIMVDGQSVADGVDDVVETEIGDMNFYDLSGRPIKRTDKGLYIMQGKKMMVR